MRKMVPVGIYICHPEGAKEKEELARKVSRLHAAAVNQRLKALNCPAIQKLALLDAVIRGTADRT